VKGRKGFMLRVAAALAVTFAGCSSGSEELTVTGKVTLDGAPLKSGQIRFVMADGQGPTAGAVISDGQYSAVLSPGEKTVEIRAAAEGPARAMYGQTPTTPPANSGGGEMIPARYNDQTELKAQVDADHVEHNFDLQGK
jgi:hypothetical protein